MDEPDYYERRQRVANKSRKRKIIFFIIGIALILLLIVGIILAVVLPLQKHQEAAQVVVPVNMTFLTIAPFLPYPPNLARKKRATEDSETCGNPCEPYRLLREVINKWKHFVEVDKTVQIRIWPYNGLPLDKSNYFTSIDDTQKALYNFFNSATPVAYPNQSLIVAAYNTDQQLSNKFQWNSLLLTSPSLADYGDDNATMYNDMQAAGILLNDIVTSDIHQLLVVGPQLDDNQMQYYGSTGASVKYNNVNHVDNNNFTINNNYNPSHNINYNNSTINNNYSPSHNINYNNFSGRTYINRSDYGLFSRPYIHRSDYGLFSRLYISRSDYGLFSRLYINRSDYGLFSRLYINRSDYGLFSR
uniref:Uncharacterized protein n=1 Tax=Acrobeloides nanus TaxID=290746 RepID=A0A914EEA2_9BILA